MDSVTQAVLGASIYGAMMGPWQGRKALLYGAVLGTLPDMDVVLDYGDAVANMTFHRGFSHSLFVLGGISVLLAWCIRRWRPHPGYSGLRLWLAIWLLLSTHVLLDAFTSYGTQLFWPFSPPPAAISSIFIIDPLYTLPLLLAVVVGAIWGLQRTGMRWQYAALALSTLYLGSTLLGKQMADQQLLAAMHRDGIQAEHTFSSPTPFNTVLWRVVAVDGDDYYEGVVSWLDKSPPRLERLPRNATAGQQALSGSQAHDRLRWFTRDTLRYDLIDGYWVVTDLRLGMTGYHPFRFPLAQVTGDSVTVIEAPEQWPTPPADFSQLGMLRQRALDPDYPLSLYDLAQPLTQSMAMPPGR
ncbi:metal-dependent hydrolase [Halopseudomonas salegens]|uniref:Inner membrane protein n=1 Tax=Halopseudomonas salegens TaxID=1434072 RepID=A0A1H2G5B7_9GAMM|nr:metal-dependent hydrolase [Halopseudomonas salegens]SDU14508.1 inner membrane protein [Halopseudomonas salegens]